MTSKCQFRIFHFILNCTRYGAKKFYLDINKLLGIIVNKQPLFVDTYEVERYFICTMYVLI